MINKIFGSGGGGSAAASIDYLLNEEKHNGQIRILQGDLELSKRIAETSGFKNSYTVGCLSFEERNIAEQHK